jgi:hypothetical protein
MAALGSTSVGYAKLFYNYSHPIHSAELIYLRVHIRGYARSTLLFCAIREFVRFYLGLRETVRLYRLTRIKSPCCLE